MLEWLAQTFAKHTLGYAVRWYRSRLKVSLATHIEQSWSDRSISITNHGKTPIIVDSWTVHLPVDDVLPQLAERLGRPEAERVNQISRVRRFSSRIARLPYKGTRMAKMNDLSGLLAQSMLHELHCRHELLDPGARQRIEAGESAVRSFPRVGAVRQTPIIVSNTQRLTIIPSCHIVGHRGRVWGLPSYLFGGPIPMSAQFTPPHSDDQD